MRDRRAPAKAPPSKMQAKKTRKEQKKKKGAKQEVKRLKTAGKTSEPVVTRHNAVTFTVPARRKDHLHGCCLCEDSCVKSARRAVKVEADADKAGGQGEADVSTVKREEPDENGANAAAVAPEVVVKQEKREKNGENAGAKDEKQKSEESDYIKCAFPKCSQKMHRACAEDYVCSEYSPKQAQLLFGTDGPVCPAHACWHCYEERYKNAARFGELINCEQCMRSFHPACMPAGCKITSTSGKRKTFVCHYHAPPDHAPTIGAKMRVKYCTECEQLVKVRKPRAADSGKKGASSSRQKGKAKDEEEDGSEEGGKGEECDDEEGMERVECKGCTNVFHMKCTYKEIKGPEAEKYKDGYCSYCTVGAVIVPNQTVLAYFPAAFKAPAGNFPAIAQAIDAIPADYRKKLAPKLGRLGYIPVRWVWDGVLSPYYNMIHKSQVQRMTQSCEKNLPNDDFLDELKRCASSFSAPTVPLDNDEMRKTIKIITESVYMKGVARELEKKEILECNCTPIGGVKCATSACHNRAVAAECSKFCDEADGVRCANRAMQQQSGDEGGGEAKKYEVRLAPNSKGFGLFATRTIKPLEYLFEYAGEIIDKKEHERREDRMTKLRANDEWTYFMGLTERLVVDARFKGGDARYANHSCDPNTEATSVDVPVRYLNSDYAMYEPKLKVQALRTIKKGEEITYNYGMVKSRGLALDTCRCGSKNCSGKIGKKAKKDDEDDERFDKIGSLNDSEEKENQSKAKTKKRSLKIKLPKKKEEKSEKEEEEEKNVKNVKAVNKRRRVSLGASTSLPDPKRSK